jgi:hypothetical protein
MEVYLGTVNDGTTDNTAYLQAAVNAVAAAPTYGGTVHIPAGLFRIVGPVNVPDRVCVAGDWRGGTNIIVTHASNHVFNLTGGNVCIRDLKFTTSIAKAGGALIKLTAGTGGEFYNLNSESEAKDHGFGFWNGIEVDGAIYWTVHDCNFNNCLNDGFLVYGSGDVGMVYNVNVSYQGSLGSGGRAGFEITSSGDHQIIGCQFVGTAFGIAILPPAGKEVAAMRVTNTLLDHNAIALWIKADGANASANRNYFDRVDFTSAQQEGVKLETANGGSIDGVFLNEPNILFNGYDGLKVYDTGVKNLRISGGQVARNGGKGINIGAGMSGFSVIGARIGNTSAMDGNQVTGIGIHASADNFIVSNNDFRTNLGTPYTNSTVPSSTKVFVNNIP